MQLLNLMARVMGTVHPIMTVAVKQHQVGEPRIGAVRILMMHFEPITCCEVQPGHDVAALDRCAFGAGRLRAGNASRACLATPQYAGRHMWWLPHLP
jgi:hypothetical protein